jgi:hypothetical protein
MPAEFSIWQVIPYVFMAAIYLAVRPTEDKVRRIVETEVEKAMRGIRSDLRDMKEGMLEMNRDIKDLLKRK